MSIMIVEPQPQIVEMSQSQTRVYTPDYWSYFNFIAAVRTFLTPFHASRGGQSFTDLRRQNHTYRTYRDNIKRFLAWLKTRQIDGVVPFPDEPLMNQYVLYLRRPCGRYVGANGKTHYRDPYHLIEAKHHHKGHVLSSSSINTYLAPIRVFLRKLKPLPIPILFDPDPAKLFMALQLRDDVDKAYRQLDDAADFKGLPADEVLADSPLYAHGKRLSQDALYNILAFVQNKPNSDLRKKRDWAIWLTFILTGMRISSIARITRNSIKEEAGGEYSVDVLHKGRKRKPVSLDEIAVWAIDAYIECYNKSVGGKGDPRYIHPDQPIWRNLTPKYGTPFDYLESAAPSNDSMLRDVIKNYSRAAGYAIAPHDLRRTLAALAESLGMDIKDLSAQLCHASLDQTMQYVGERRNFAARNIANLEGFWLADALKTMPTSNPQPHLDLD